MTVVVLKAGQSVTYEGSDGQRHYAHVDAVHADGTVTVSRGYYGTHRVRFTAADRVRVETFR